MRKVDELIDLASSLGLSITAEMLAAFPYPDALQAATQETLDPAAPELTELLNQLTRRGLDLRLVGSLLDHFAGRPLEQGLIAWDVLAQTIFPTDRDEDQEALFSRLHDALAEVRAHLGSPLELGLPLGKQSAATLLAAQHREPARLVAGMKDLDLASVAHALLAEGKTQTIARSPALAGAVSGLGKLLARAHLPTLASLYLDLAVRDLDHRPSALLLYEVMFDAGAGARLGGELLRKGDVPAEEVDDLFEYILYRAKINDGDTLNALAVFKTNRLQRGKSHSPRLAAVQVDLAARIRDDLPPTDSLDEACLANELWHYGWRQRVTLRTFDPSLSEESLRPLELIGEFIARFGNDFRCWYDALLATPGAAPWKLAACGALGREVQTLPHEVGAWKALMVAVAPDPETVQGALTELEDLLDAQVEGD